MSWFEYSGSRIYFEEEGAGSPVLFLPGWSESIEEFADLRRTLARNFRVIAADLPGSGKSGPQPRSYTPTYYDDDARAFLALLKSLDAAPAHLAGFSDGGEVALVMAALDPASVRSVAAWGAMGEVCSPPVIQMFGSAMDSQLAPVKALADHLKAMYGEENARLMCRSAAAAWAELAASGGSISRSRASNIACPTLLIAGELDFIVPATVVASLAQVIPGAQFELMKGAGHVMHVDCGDALAEAVVGFLRRRDG